MALIRKNLKEDLLSNQQMKMGDPARIQVAQTRNGRVRVSESLVDGRAQYLERKVIHLIS